MNLVFQRATSRHRLLLIPSTIDLRAIPEAGMDQDREQVCHDSARLDQQQQEAISFSTTCSLA